MLVRIHPDQFRKGWNAFAPLVQDAFPPDLSVQSQSLVNVLRAVLMERATPWVEVDEDTGESRAFVLTTVDQEPVMFEKRLLIYVLTVFGEPGDISEWRSAIETLRGHARKKECQSIVTYVRDEEYARYLSMLGADISTIQAQFEV